MKKMRVQVLAVLFASSTMLFSCQTVITFAFLGIELIGDHIIDSYFGNLIDEAGDKIMSWFGHSGAKTTDIGTIIPLDNNNLLGKRTEDLRPIIHYRKKDLTLTDTITISKDLITFQRPSVDSTWRLTSDSRDFVLKKIDVSAVQLALRSYDCYSGAINGVMGKRTLKGIKKFQRENGITASGELTASTKELLLNLKPTTSL